MSNKKTAVEEFEDFREQVDAEYVERQQELLSEMKEINLYLGGEPDKEENETVH